MGRYETFVVRLWVENHADMLHGEIRHLRSGTGLRFRQFRQAERFVDQVLERLGERVSEVESEATREA